MLTRYIPDDCVVIRADWCLRQLDRQLRLVRLVYILLQVQLLELRAELR